MRACKQRKMSSLRLKMILLIPNNLKNKQHLERKKKSQSTYHFTILESNLDVSFMKLCQNVPTGGAHFGLVRVKLPFNQPSTLGYVKVSWFSSSFLQMHLCFKDLWMTQSSKAQLDLKKNSLLQTSKISIPSHPMKYSWQPPPSTMV